VSITEGDYVAFNLGATATSITGASLGYTFYTPSGVEGTVKLGRGATNEIGANLYMKFVKSKLGKVQIERSKQRLKKLQNLIAYTKEMGQRALYEALCEEAAILVRETEIVAFGITQWVERNDIEKFRNLVKEKVIKFEPKEKFPRVIPRKIQDRLKALEKAKVFDEFHILFIDYTGKELKTTKEKIRSKDPILFGTFAHQRDRLYYIADWVDEYCDLTLEKFVSKFKETDPEYGISQVPDITEERWKSIVEEVKARHQRLADTKGSNWRELEAEEAQATTTQMKDNEKTGKRWWRIW
jgi:hypothetical protein